MSTERHTRIGHAPSVPHLLIAGLLLLLAAPAAFAQKASPDVLPGSDRIGDFEVVSELALEIDGKEIKNAKFYFSEYDVAHVITGPGLPTVLVSPRGDSVQKIDAKKLVRGEGISAALEDHAVAEYVGEYKREFGDVRTFEVDGQTWKIRPREPMLGRQSAEVVNERHPRYAHQAEVYGRGKGAKADELKALAARQVRKSGGPDQDLLIRMYFTSGSPICERLVSRMMWAEKELRSELRNVRFEYYGLPRDITTDPMATKEGLSSVPTLVAYAGDEKVAQVWGRILDDPAAALREVLDNL